MSSLVLDRKQTIQLIQAYGARRHLWDAGDPRYFNRKLRDRAWRQIASQLALAAPAASLVPDLKKKLVSLLGSYRREKSREKQSIRAGLGPEEAYKSKWYGYEHFHFMAEKTFAGAALHAHAHITHDHDHDALELFHNIKVEYEDSDMCVTNDPEAGEQTMELSSPPAASPLPLPQPRVKRRRARRAQADTSASEDDGHAEGLGNDTTPQDSKELPQCDAFHTFGMYIASELRKYDDVTLAHVKHAINNVIFEADMGTYRRLVAPVEEEMKAATGVTPLADGASSRPPSSISPNDHDTKTQ